MNMFNFFQPQHKVANPTFTEKLTYSSLSKTACSSRFEIRTQGRYVLLNIIRLTYSSKCKKMASINIPFVELEKRNKFVHTPKIHPRFLLMHCPLWRFKTVPKAKIDENLHDQDDKCLVFFCELYVSMRESAVEVWLRRVVTRWTSIIIDYP
jgi:hypothetical protein